MNNSIKRLQTPLQDLYLHRLSSNFARPRGNPANPMVGGIAPNTMRGQQHFQREVLNRAQIFLLEFSYRTDIAARTGTLNYLCPTAGAGVAGQTCITNYDGTNTVINAANDTDQIAWTGDGNYELVTTPGTSGDYIGKRRVTWPEPFPHAGAHIAGAAG